MLYALCLEYFFSPVISLSYLRKVLGKFEDTINSPSRVTPETHSHIWGIHQCIVFRGKQYPAFYYQSKTTSDTYLIYYIRVWIQIMVLGSIILAIEYISISLCSVCFTLVDFWYSQPRLNTNRVQGSSKGFSVSPYFEIGYSASFRLNAVQISVSFRTWQSKICTNERIH